MTISWPGRPTAIARSTDTDRRDLLARRIRWVVAATITCNVTEALVALTTGVQASSTALVGFGLDSVIEVTSAAAVAWQFSTRDHATRQAREHRTLRIVALCFFALAAYVAVEAGRGFLVESHPATSIVGIALAVASIAVMPALSHAQRRNGREIGSASAVADSRQALLCTYSAVALLVGLVLNAAVGWWWADPLAAVVIAGVAAREGRNAWKGESCCVPRTPASTDDDRAEPCGCGGTCCQ